jgi:hypothetical protein
MQDDSGAVLLGGMIGSGSLLLAWAVVQLGHALTKLTEALRSGIRVTVTGESEGGDKGKR